MTRDQLITGHLDYVKKLTAQLKHTYRLDTEFDELVSLGNEGLVEAAERFDPKRGIAFTTFAYYRIRGAIFDGVRKQLREQRSHVPMQIEACANELLGNSAERETNVTDDLETTIQGIADTVNQLVTVAVLSLDYVPEAQLEDPDALSSIDALLQKEERLHVKSAIQRLPEKEAELITSMYYEGLSIKAAGERLGLSKSWASRLHRRAIRLLTESLST